MILNETKIIIHGGIIKGYKNTKSIFEIDINSNNLKCSKLFFKFGNIARTNMVAYKQ